MNRSNNHKTVRKYQLIHWLFTFLLCAVAAIGVAFFDKASMEQLPGAVTVFALLIPIYFIGTLPVFVINLQLAKLIVRSRMSDPLRYIVVNLIGLLVAAAIMLFYFCFTEDMGAFIFMLCAGIYLAAFVVSGLLWNWFAVYKGSGKPVVNPVE
jgi:cation transport ATPase